jgi:hypothetical protein
MAMIVNSLAYMVRWTMIRSFIFQCIAEQAALSFKTLFNNLPDAVIVLEKLDPISNSNPINITEELKVDSSKDMHNYHLHYCNQQADELFDVNLSLA